MTIANATQLWAMSATALAAAIEERVGILTPIDPKWTASNAAGAHNRGAEG